jgi:hypothetical protein|tara:strand:- start:2869 stop:3402 length:534 start_codon:yes stop_codon:yes gene_type:complete
LGKLASVQGVATWENAAEDAIYRVLGNQLQVAEDAELSDPLLDLRSNLDFLVKNYLQAASGPGGPDSQVFVQFWQLLGFRAAKELQRLGEIPDSIELAAEQIGTILASKQRDYGHDNIARFGRTGLMIRMHDKIARLENLRGSSPSNETVADNLLDVIGYSVIGLMWENGSFMLQLR